MHGLHTSTAGVSLKDDGPTGQTTGQSGSDPSAYRLSITGYYNILQGIKSETTQKTWILLSSNAHTHSFNGPFSGTTRVSRYQKGKTNLDFTEARDSE